MVEQVFRSMLLAGVASAMGMRAAEKVERRLAGGRAMSVRAHIAHRAFMALLFRRVKQG
jgi:hypothetical protein